MITTHPYRPPARHPAGRRFGRAAAAIAVAIGSLATLGALALLVLFGPSGTLDPGAFPPISTPTAALVVDPGTVTDTSAAAQVLGEPTVRVSATYDGTPVFVGIGRAVDVDRYLSGVASDMVAVGADGSVPTGLDRHPGQKIAAPPTEQTFWAASTTSAATAEVTWPIQDGTYRIVVMNADGTPGLTTQVHAAVTVPNMFSFSLGLLFGGLLLTGAGVAVLVAARRRPTA
ncbi:hypothetical protein ACVGOW_19340 [Pseudonocardia saturnea]